MPKTSAKKASAPKQQSRTKEPTPGEKQLLALKKKLTSSVQSTLRSVDVKVVRPQKKFNASGGGVTKWDNDIGDPVRWSDFDHSDPEHSVGPGDIVVSP